MTHVINTHSLYLLGHQRLNTAFVANLFNHYPNLEDEEGEEIEEDVEETREEKSKL